MSLEKFSMPDLILELIACHKHAVKAEKRSMYSEHRHRRNEIVLISDNQQYKFKMFMRISNEFIEDFSVGLIWTNPNEFIGINKSIILLRCQGPHDSKMPLKSDIHHSYHIHQMTEDDLLHKRYQKPSNSGITEEFHSFNQAVLYFVNKCAIIGVEEVIDDFPSEEEQLLLKNWSV